MLHVRKFTFNPVQENTYVIYDDTLEAAIIDCGCMSPQEEQELYNFVTEKRLNPKLLLNTHLHFDHVWGNAWAIRTWPEMKVYCHKYDLSMPPKPSHQLRLFGIDSPLENLPDELYRHVGQGDSIPFGQTLLEVLHIPGHSPGHIAFYAPADKVVFSGDALFYRDIGRTDLWGGSYSELLDSVRTQLFTLPSDTIVYPGHGDETTIGEELKHNPYFS